MFIVVFILKYRAKHHDNDVFNDNGVVEDKVADGDDGYDDGCFLLLEIIIIIIVIITRIMVTFGCYSSREHICLSLIKQRRKWC